MGTKRNDHKPKCGCVFSKKYMSEKGNFEWMKFKFDHSLVFYWNCLKGKNNRRWEVTRKINKITPTKGRRDIIQLLSWLKTYVWVACGRVWILRTNAIRSRVGKRLDHVFSFYELLYTQSWPELGNLLFSLKNNERTCTSNNHKERSGSFSKHCQRSIIKHAKATTTKLEDLHMINMIWRMFKKKLIEWHPHTPSTLNIIFSITNSHCLAHY